MLMSKSRKHVNPLLKVLATGLDCIVRSLTSQTQTTPARMAGVGWVWLARLDYIGKHLAGMQTRTQFEKSACTQLTRVVKLDLRN